jgi:hypothetical protein
MSDIYTIEPADNRPQTQIDIVVNGKVLGTVDVTTLKARAQFDLEDCSGVYDLLDWLVKYAGVTETDLPAIRDELGEMNVQAIVDLTMTISEAIGSAMHIPNAKRPDWRRRSSTAPTRRSGR